MRIAVVGGTGWVGRYVVHAAAAQGHKPVVVARSTGADLLTGAGLATALTGAEAVIDVSNIRTASGARATAFFETATTNLLTAEHEAGVAHHVVLSIVGVDRVGLGYYRAKRRQEEVALAGDLPVTVLRATQFHEFAAQMLSGRGPVAITPRMLCRPVAAREVGEALVAQAVGPAVGMAPELAGPQQEQMLDLVRRLVSARGRHTRVLGVKIPGAVGRGMTGGGLLPTADGPRGTVTFEQWLAEGDTTGPG